MSHSIQCVHCKAVLKSAAPVPAGKKIKCPKCQQLFTTGVGDLEIPDKNVAIPAQIEPDEPLDEEDEMARAIAKLEAEQAGGKKPAPAAPKQEPVIQPAPASLAGSGAMSEDDEMDAAIAKLEAEQAAGKKSAPAPPKPAAPAPPPSPAEEEIPEIDDDLVMPDEEEEAPKKKKLNKKDAEPVSKKKKRRDEDEEDDEPPVKKKKREEEEDDEPRAKKKKRDIEEDTPPAKTKKRDDDEVDDEPRVKKKKSRDDEGDDGAFADETQPKKGKRREDPDDDEDEDEELRSVKKKGRDDDEEDATLDFPRETGKKKKAGSSMMLALLLGGGLIGLFACCGLSIGGYFLFFSAPSIAGNWEGDQLGGLVKMRWEFTSFGTGKLKVKAELFQAQKEEGTVNFTYKIIRGDPMILEVVATSVEGAAKNNNNIIIGRAERINVRLDGDTMTLTQQGNAGGFGGGMTLRRVR